MRVRERERVELLEFGEIREEGRDPVVVDAAVEGEVLDLRDVVQDGFDEVDAPPLVDFEAGEVRGGARGADQVQGVVAGAIAELVDVEEGPAVAGEGGDVGAVADEEVDVGGYDEGRDGWEGEV